ncbi:MAG TPA: M23 family metallopeptidase [Chloroflexota bacterium]
MTRPDGIIALVAALFLSVVVALAVVTGVGGPSYVEWWLSNRAPPEVRIAVPSTPVRGVVTVEVELAPEGRADVAELSLDGLRLAPTRRLTLDTRLLVDGTHTLVVEAEDYSRHRNRARATATLVTDNTPPTLTVDVRPTTPTQGETFWVQVRTDEPADLAVRLDGRALPLLEEGAAFWALGGVAANAPLGSRALQVEAVDGVGNRSVADLAVRVEAGDFPSEDVVVAEEQVENPDEARAQERLARVLAQVTTPRRWRDPFQLPLQGPVTTVYGTRRSYNGVPQPAYFHAGVDLAAPAGAPVGAANAGRVVLAEALGAYGNAVVLDHGLGVFTLYAHLDEVLVAVGDDVPTGHVLGTVGSTGRSTGPHLHWEVRVGQVAVDPMAWLGEYPWQ